MLKTNILESQFQGGWADRIVIIVSYLPRELVMFVSERNVANNTEIKIVSHLVRSALYLVYKSIIFCPR